MNKFWKDCSRNEKAEVREIEKAYRVITWQVTNNWIPRAMYQRGCQVLLRRLDAIEVKYANL